VVREGVDVAIVGPVNSGKSSLFNALLEKERAIVTAEPGTTRDFVEATVVWQGLQITLIDTAGEREEFDSEAERRGMELARDRRQRAELVVVTHEAPLGGDIEPSEGHLDVVTKADLSAAPAQLLSTSALSGTGIAQLRDAIVAAVLATTVDAGEGEMVTSERHCTLLMRSASALKRGAALIGKAPAEVVAVELREGVLALAEIFGEEVGEEVLDAVFSRFCIGK
jgi:tRNA modification GTPase